MVRRVQPGILAGILAGTSYIPFPPWAVLGCWLPLWVLLERRVSCAEAFRQAWVAQFVLSLIGGHWVAHTAHEFGGLPWPVAVAVLLAFATCVHLYIPMAFALAAWLVNRLRLAGPVALVVAALLHALLERGWPTLFPWNQGYTLLWAGIPAYQWADTIGFSGLSALLLLGNAWLSWIWILHRQQRPVRRQLLLYASTLLLVVGTGHRKGVHAQPRAGDPRVQLLVVQPNVGGAALRDAGRAGGAPDEAVLASLVELTEIGVRDTVHRPVDAIVWPETAVPRDLSAPLAGHGLTGQVAEAVRRWGLSLVTGGYVLDGVAAYNALTVVSPQGEASARPHRKSILIPFGEYLPGGEALPWLSALVPRVSPFAPGDGPRVLALPVRADTLLVGAQICYEGLFPAFSRALGEQGAQLLVNVANDSWFGGPFEPHQHLVATLARGIELRRPVVRSTNTGISVAMDAAGRMSPRSPRDAPWQGRVAVPYERAPRRTAWQRYGHRDWMIWLLLLLALLGRGAADAGSRRVGREVTARSGP